MTTYLIKIDSKESLEWLTKLIDNTITGDPNSNAMIHSYIHLKAWHDALSAPLTDKDVMMMDEHKAVLAREIKSAAKPKPVTKRPPAKKTRTKSKLPKVNEPFTCKDHPTYQIKTVPRTACVRCWDLYKQLHPQEYAAKRRAFDRKQAKK